MSCTHTFGLLEFPSRASCDQINLVSIFLRQRIFIIGEQLKTESSYSSRSWGHHYVLFEREANLIWLIRIYDGLNYDEFKFGENNLKSSIAWSYGGRKLGEKEFLDLIFCQQWLGYDYNIAGIGYCKLCQGSLFLKKNLENEKIYILPK
jgi:hypothetical protein